MLQHFAYVFIKKIVHISITFFRICEDLFMGSIFPLSTPSYFSSTDSNACTCLCGLLANLLASCAGGHGLQSHSDQNVQHLLRSISRADNRVQWCPV